MNGWFKPGRNGRFLIGFAMFWLLRCHAFRPTHRAAPQSLAFPAWKSCAQTDWNEGILTSLCLKGGIQNQNMLGRYVLASACEREVVHTREKWPKYACLLFRICLGTHGQMSALSAETTRILYCSRREKSIQYTHILAENRQLTIVIRWHRGT